MYKKIVLFCVCLFSLLLFVSCGQNRNDAETLIVGTNGEFPPFTFLKEGELLGFDIDIAKEVGKRLNKTVVFKDMPFDALIPDLALGNIDFIAAGMSYTEERAQRVSFSKPYITDEPLVIFTLPKDDSQLIRNLDELTGKTVVVNEGYTSERLLAERSDLNLVRLSAPAEAFLALKSGRADAFVTEKRTVLSFLETQSDLKFHYENIEGTAENCALVFSKMNEKLLVKVQKILDKMEEDGTIAQIKQKWKLG